MARPCKPDPYTAKPSLRLYPGEDDDLIAYLDQAQTNGLSLAAAVVAAMRGGIANKPVTAVEDEGQKAETLFSMLM